MSGMPALDKGPKANCHGTALLASSAGIRQTPPQRSSVASASTRNLAQHQLRAIGEVVKFCRCPHTMASNKILPIATDVVVIRRRLRMGGLVRVRSTRQVPRSRIGGAEEVLAAPYPHPPKVRTGVTGDGQIWALLTATGPRETEHCTASRHSAGAVCSRPISARACVPFL